MQVMIKPNQTAKLLPKKNSIYFNCFTLISADQNMRNQVLTVATSFCDKRCPATKDHQDFFFLLEGCLY